MTVIQKPKYQQISLDIARKIINGNLKEGERIFGRSELAALYNVSPETIRRAIAVLKDMGVVEVTQGSGIIIKSKELAFRYVNRFNETYSIVQIKNEIKNLIENKKEIDNKIDNLIEKVVEYSSSLKNINPFN
ncbi:MAG: winged helix-turn-helix domain-containing protein, partial [Thermoanaerobacteraceae bacterium]